MWVALLVCAAEGSTKATSVTLGFLKNKIPQISQIYSLIDAL